VVYLDEASTNLKMPGDKKANCNAIPEPNWHDVRIGFDESAPVCGQVLCSFAIVESDFVFEQSNPKKVDLSKTVMTTEYNLEINVLGLRSLESFGLMPIKKPYIKFRVKSMLPPEKAQAITNVQTDPNANGPNPNINTSLHFNV